MPISSRAARRSMVIFFIESAFLVFWSFNFLPVCAGERGYAYAAAQSKTYDPSHIIGNMFKIVPFLLNIIEYKRRIFLCYTE